MSFHELCNRVYNFGSDYALPSRVIDVGLADGSEPARLVIPEEQGEDADVCPYVVLSHCWGNPQSVPKTMRNTLNNHLEVLDWDSLTPTFQDAIRITRHLRIRYLWIDSLCIVQDDSEDFERECARMHFIYMRAFCTIAASDSSNGFGDCRSNAIIFSAPRQRLMSSTKDWSTRRLDGPLKTRGWAFQELQLSPRIISYRKKCVSWECRACVSEEEAPAMLSRSELSMKKSRILDGHIEFLPETINSMPGGIVEDSYFNRWLLTTEEYSARKLSFQASLFKPGQYYAGIWTKDIVRSLCWEKAVNGIGCRLPAADIPSWSWASMQSPIKYDFVHTPSTYGKHPLFSVNFAESGTNVHGIDRYRRIRGGKLTVSGQLRDYHQAQAGVAPRPFFRVKFDVISSFEDLFSKEDGANTKLYCLSILLTKGLTDLR
jgi:hypothetical protein